MDRIPPTLSPKLYTLSAMIIGYALIDSFTANEQNSIGNWFMTIGQILECNATFQQTIEERFMGNTININNKAFKKHKGSPYMHNKGYYTRDDDKNNKTYDYSQYDEFSLEKVICIMKEELEKMKKSS